MRFSTFIARDLLRRRVRSVLTVLGLAIGIAAVVALLGIAWGFERSFLAIYEAKGIDLVVIRAGVGDSLSSSLDEDLADRLRGIEGVKQVAGSLMESVSFEEAGIVSALVDGWEPGGLLFGGVRLLEGRALEPDDRGQLMLGRVLALSLGKQVGDPLDVAGVPFRVVGTFESPSWIENGALILPLTEAQTMFGRPGQVTGFVISADQPADPRAVADLGRRIEAALPGVAAVPARDHVRNNAQIRLAKAMAWATSVIAFVLGSVGVLNTMIMAVFERTGEIGVLRALGWRRRRVLSLILGESLILGLIGALLGLALGVAGVRALVLAPTARGFIAPDVPPITLAVGLVLGVSLSFLGGLYPALRAAALDPTEALRHD